MPKMTAEQFGNEPLPSFYNATDENVGAALRMIESNARNSDAADLANVAMTVRSLIENYRLHPGAASDLVRSLGHATYIAMAKFEQR